MPWNKPKDKEPPNQDDEYFLRGGGDKYIGWWDAEQKEFYMIEQSVKFSYFGKDDYPNIEWWDELEPSQDELWEEIDQMVFYESGGNRVLPDYVIDQFKEKYTLIRK